MLPRRASSGRQRSTTTARRAETVRYRRPPIYADLSAARYAAVMHGEFRSRGLLDRLICFLGRASRRAIRPVRSGHMADTGVEAAPVGAPPIGPTKGSEHRRLKVLRVINSLGTRFGGPSVSCVGAAIGEKRAGADTTLVFADSGDRANSSAPARRRLAAEEIPFIEFPLVPFVEPLLARLLGRDSSRWGVSLGLSWWLLRNHRKFDVIHVHGVWGLGATTVLALKRFAP